MLGGLRLQINSQSAVTAPAVPVLDHFVSPREFLAFTERFRLSNVILRGLVDIPIQSLVRASAVDALAASFRQDFFGWVEPRKNYLSNLCGSGRKFVSLSKISHNFLDLLLTLAFCQRTAQFVNSGGLF